MPPESPPPRPLTPIDDLRATADYRSSQVATMVERGLLAIGGDQQAARWPTGPTLP
ncbi:MAG: hypothetical protein R2697_15905 [Ilumatobacteraceae bacterium]